MKQRVITAAVALLVFLPAVIVGGIFIELLAVLLGIVAVYELFKMRNLELKSLEGVVTVLGVVFLIFPFDKYVMVLPNDSNWILFFVSVLLLLGMVVFSNNAYTFEDAGFPILSMLYVGVGFSYFVQARESSVEALFLALFIVWATDIGAYMVGRKYGVRKLAPNISPNKTVEGSIGGVLSAVVITMIFLFLFPSSEHFDLPFVYVVIMSAVFSVFGQFGDLVESSIKRYYGVKDSGNILPGHGGILDRFDSLLFVFPIMHLFNLF
ncbi:MAG: phosphatidate cytidylyltransferase [Streptococcaceae bacterium]|nr:phosphatidate cytidylyltransferase [Streptococcaceae bacterium]